MEVDALISSVKTAVPQAADSTIHKTMYEFSCVRDGIARRAACPGERRQRGLSAGRQKALTPQQVEQVLTLREAKTPVVKIASTFGVARQTVYRVLHAAEAQCAPSPTAH
jgi:hypothetical protein